MRLPKGQKSDTGQARAGYSRASLFFAPPLHFTPKRAGLWPPHKKNQRYPKNKKPIKRFCENNSYICRQDVNIHLKNML
jgi:hypothetical protein